MNVFAIVAGIVAVFVVICVIQIMRGARDDVDAPFKPSAIAGDGYFSQDVVGEASYQDALESLAGRGDEPVEHRCVALLVSEPSNPHDRNAIKVTINDATVGYIATDETSYFHAINAGRPVKCKAVIVGGWDRGQRGNGYYGVRLDVAWPPRLS